MGLIHYVNRCGKQTKIRYFDSELVQCWFNVGSMLVNHGVDVSYLLRLSARCNLHGIGGGGGGTGQDGTRGKMGHCDVILLRHYSEMCYLLHVPVMNKLTSVVCEISRQQHEKRKR